MKRFIIKICGWLLDIGLIAGMELIQFILIVTGFLSYEANRSYQGGLICVTIVLNICVISFIRHTAIKGMPSKWLMKLIQNLISVHKKHNSDT